MIDSSSCTSASRSRTGPASPLNRNELHTDHVTAGLSFTAGPRPRLAVGVEQVGVSGRRSARRWLWGRRRSVFLGWRQRTTRSSHATGESCPSSAPSCRNRQAGRTAHAATRLHHRRLDAGVPVRIVQEAASHADPRTTMRYDRGRQSSFHAIYIVATFIADAARWRPPLRRSVPGSATNRTPERDRRRPNAQVRRWLVDRATNKAALVGAQAPVWALPPRLRGGGNYRATVGAAVKVGLRSRPERIRAWGNHVCTCFSRSGQRR